MGCIFRVQSFWFYTFLVSNTCHVLHHTWFQWNLIVNFCCIQQGRSIISMIIIWSQNISNIPWYLFRDYYIKTVAANALDLSSPGHQPPWCWLRGIWVIVDKNIFLNMGDLWIKIYFWIWFIHVVYIFAKTNHGCGRSRYWFYVNAHTSDMLNSKFILCKDIYIFQIYVSNVVTVSSCCKSLWIIVYFATSFYQVYLYNLMTQALLWHHNSC